MTDESILLPLPTLARHLAVPERVFLDLAPTRPATAARGALYELTAAQRYLRERAVVFWRIESLPSD